MKRKPVVIIIVVVCIFAAMIAGFILSFRTHHYSSLDQYLGSAHAIFSDLIPEDHTDFQGAKSQFLIFGGNQVCGFTLSESAFEEYKAAINTKAKEDYHDTYSEYTGVKVSDIDDVNPEEEWDGFHADEFCSNVTDKPISEYEVLFYMPAGSTGGVTNAIFVDEESGRVVVYRGGSN